MSDLNQIDDEKDNLDLAYWLAMSCTDSNKTLEILDKAASQGHIQSIHKLGEFFLEGKIVEEDYDKAAKLFEKAAMQGYAKSLKELYFMYENGDVVCHNSDEFIELIEKFPDAFFEIGCAYLSGDRVEEDLETAFNFFKNGASKGSLKAKYYLGRMYFYGEGVEQNYNVAIKLIWEAAEELPEAQSFLSAQYFSGTGVEQDFEMSFGLAKEAVSRGYNDAKYILGILYISGNGVKRDTGKGRDLLEEAAKYGGPEISAQAKHALGLIYYKGQGAIKNIEKAKNFFKEACDAGESESCEMYEKIKKSEINK